MTKEQEQEIYINYLLQTLENTRIYASNLDKLLDDCIKNLGETSEKNIKTIYELLAQKKYPQAHEFVMNILNEINERNKRK